MYWPSARTPTMSDRRLLVSVKSNLSAPAPPLAFRVCARCPHCRKVVEGETCTECNVRTTGSIEWLGTPDKAISADALLADHERVDAEDRHSAADFLREQLKDGEVETGTILRAAKREGIAERTLTRAKKDLRIISRHEGQPGKPSRWLWKMPPTPVAPKNAIEGAPKSATPGNMAPFEQPSGKIDETADTSPKSATSHVVALFGGHLRGRVVAHLASLAPCWLTAAQIASALDVADAEVNTVLEAVIADRRGAEPYIRFRGAGSLATPT